MHRPALGSLGKCWGFSIINTTLFPTSAAAPHGSPQGVYGLPVAGTARAQGLRDYANAYFYCSILRRTQDKP